MTARARTIVFRCDGTREMGFGHVGRSIALAMAARERGYTCVFVSRSDRAALQLLRRFGFASEAARGDPGGPEDARHVASVALAASGAAIVDGYHFRAPYYRSLRRSGVRVLAIDDIAATTFPVDLLLNQNAFAHDLRYRTCPGTRRLLGTRYALIRPEFRRARRAPRSAGAPRVRVLLTFGATDVTGLSARLIRLLDRDPALRARIDVRVLLGPGARRGEARRAARRARYPVELVVEGDVAAEMARADAAVTAAGSMVLELFCVGVATAIVSVADNQLRVGRSLGARVLDLGTAAALDGDVVLAALRRAWSRPARIAALARRGMSAVDGLGAERVMDALEAVIARGRPRASGRAHGVAATRAFK